MKSPFGKATNNYGLIERSSSLDTRFSNRSFVNFAFVVLIVLRCTTPAASWSDGAGFRSLAVNPGQGGKAGFTMMSPSITGVTFTNILQGDAYLTNAVAHNGSGVAIGDVDGDGWQDIYLCNLQGPNRLYRNLGNWKFEEMKIGDAACAGQFSTGAVFADVDGDGDLDLLVNGIAAGTRLFLNDGKSHWTEAKNSGLSTTASATSMALADIDGDGDLDLYCTHYIDVMHLADPTTRFGLARRGDKWEVSKINDESTRSPKWKDRFEVLEGGRVRELPEVDGLYRNEGHGHFTAIQLEPGVFLNSRGEPIPPYRDWGLAVMFRDLNGDGAPDIFVCNDNATPSRIWINSGKGTFRELDPMKIRHMSRSSMGVDFADIDRDGRDDIIVVDMLARDHSKQMTQLVRDRSDAQTRERADGLPRYNRNTLFLGRPDGSFVEAALLAGIFASDWSWCPIFLDVDLDGFEDLLVTNGFSFDVMDQDAHDQMRRQRMSQEELKRSRKYYPAFPTKNAAFRNRGDGTFEPASHEWGFDQEGISYGMAVADLDNDGDLDVVINNLNAVAGIYRNDASAGRVAVRLKGTPPNTQGIGAKITLKGGSITQSQEMICGGRYLSGDEAIRVFAADASSEKPLTLEIKWRNGNSSLVTGVRANHIYEVNQVSSTAVAASQNPPEAQPYFLDVSSLLNHTHTEEPFDDWARQPLLPRRFSQLGPGVSWFDVDGDGWEDLIVTSGRGGKLAVFRNDQGKKFQLLDGAPIATGDQGAVLAWPDGKGNSRLLVAVSNFEMQPSAESEIQFFFPTNFAAPQSLSFGKSSPGPMALADIDGDGDLDLFVGGRFLPGKYPEPVSSGIWLNENGTLKWSRELSEPFVKIGMVNGAVFADFDGDGKPDLALAIEWGPVRVFLNRNGRFEDVSAQWGLAGTTGLWSGIAAGDFDGDGKTDLVVGNWGRNSSYEIGSAEKWRVYYGDWNSDGVVDLIEAWQFKGNWLPMRDRTWLARGLPELPQRFASHKEFGSATVADLIGKGFPESKFVEAVQLESSVFLNRGSRFEQVSLTRQAQLAPAFSVNVGDFDGDGIEDIFLSQNFYGTSSDLTRDDGGLGLWLRGTGSGRFEATDATVSGIKIYGEQRGAALGDFNHDGRVDLAVAQNNGATKLFLNQHANQGLRVVLDGPAANPNAIGAEMRVVYFGGRMGPARTVNAGSGYWSQDSSTQILGLAATPTGLWVRWPGGKQQTIPIGKGTWDLRVRFEK